MKESNVKSTNANTTAHGVGTKSFSIEDYALYVGLDVHKDTIAVAVANPGRAEPVYRGEISNSTKTIERLIKQMCALSCGGQDHP